MEWSPSSYKGATKEFKHNRLQECCILLSRVLHKNGSTIIRPPDELILYAPALAQLLKTVLQFSGVDSGAFAFMLKDSLICSQKGWKEAGAMLMGLADRFLDPFFSVLRNWGSETLAQSIFSVFSGLSNEILEEKQVMTYSNFVGHLANFMAPYGLSRVPGVPDAHEHFCKRLKPFPKNYYTLHFNNSKMTLVEVEVIYKDETQPKKPSFNEIPRCSTGVCRDSDEFLHRIWEELDNLQLHGPIDSPCPSVPNLGDYGKSAIYRMRVKDTIGEIVAPVYAARFECVRDAVGKLVISTDVFFTPNASISDIFLIIEENKCGTRAIGVDIDNYRFLFEYLAPYSDREKILKWLPGMGGNWKTKEHIDDNPKEFRSMNIGDIKPFIVHGHDDHLKLELKNYLWSTVGFGEPIILHEQPNSGRTIIEKFEDYTNDINIVFVLLTPDDVGSTANNPNELNRRSRQNVIFEMGYFVGKLTRKSGRVILLHKGPLEIPSDLSGVIYIDISNGVKAAGENIRKEIEAVLSRENS